jgi:hypothetical protein
VKSTSSGPTNYGFAQQVVFIEDIAIPDVAPNDRAEARCQPVDLMDDADAAPTAPQAPLPQPLATMIAR